MLFYIFLGLIFLYVFLANFFRAFKSKRLGSVIEATELCSLLIGIFGLIITLIIMFVTVIEPYNSDEVYDVKTKVTTDELNSVKYSNGYFNCIQGAANGEYTQTVYSAIDTKVTMKKDLAPHIETIEHTGKVGSLWIIPFATEKRSTEYHLYIPVNHPDKFQIN
jgi:hypothetical protein